MFYDAIYTYANGEAHYFRFWSKARNAADLLKVATKDAISLSRVDTVRVALV